MREGQLAQVFLTCGDTLILQAGHIIEALALHVLWSSTHSI